MTPDVNVLVAASRRDHPQHAIARAWIEQATGAEADGAGLRLLPMVVAGFLRIVTHPRIFSPRTQPEAAIAFLAALLDGPTTTVLPLGPELPLFVQLCEQHALTGNAVPDAWIAAAVRHHGERLATFDRGFLSLLSAGELELLPAAAAAG